MLGSLRAPLDVTAWVTTGTPELDAFGRLLEALFARYERLAPGKIHARVIRDGDADQRAAATEAGLVEGVLGERGGVARRGFLGIAFKYRSEKEAIPIVAPDQARGLEFWVDNKIREIRDRADDARVRVGVLSGKRELKLSEPNLVAADPGRAGPSLRGIMEQALPFYRFEDVDLRGGAAEIDRALVGVIITQPGQDYTEAELRRIDAFLLSGDKAAAVFASAVNVEAGDASLRARLDRHGLDRLLDGYGVEMKRDAVFDWASPATLRVMTQGGAVVVGHPATLLVQADARADAATQTLDGTFPGFFRMDELSFPFPSTLVPHPERQPGARLKVVARSTPRATAVTTDVVPMKPGAGEMKPVGEYAQRALAVVVEGELRSAFGGSARGQARLLVVSGSQFLANPYARAGNPPPVPASGAGDEELMMMSQPYAQQYLTATILAFKNTLDWMASDEDLIGCSALLGR
jgi:hypothetical protein